MTVSTTEEKKRGYDPRRAIRKLQGTGFVLPVLALLCGAGGVIGYQYAQKHGFLLPSVRFSEPVKPEAVPVSPPVVPEAPKVEPVETPSPVVVPTEPPQPVIEGETRAALLLSRVEPEYPALAREARMSGTVKLYATIGDDGRVLVVEVDEGNPILAAAAVKAVKQWTYEPALLRGKPTFSKLSVTVNFRLDGR